MIKSLEQATNVQHRRVADGKKGYAKAVRAFLQREHNSDYMKVRDTLPVKSW